MAEAASGNEKSSDRYDVLRYSDETYRSVPAGAGEEIIAAHESEARKRRWIGAVAAGVLVFVIVVIGGIWALDGTLVPAGIGIVMGIVSGVIRYWQLDYSDQIPELTISDASTRAVRKYTDEFDSDKTAGSIN
jgi:hypothetical protein